MKRTAKELDEVVESWVEEHKKRRDECEKHYLDLLIEIFKNREIPGTTHGAHTTTKAICLNMVFAGSEPAIVVLVWAVSLLVNNPHELRKAQEELDQKIGRDRVETLRLYPPLPLTTYRYVMEGFDIANGNFHVPAGTQVLVNDFDLATPFGQDVDMTESNGFVNLKASPLQVLINPRLPKSLYHVDRKV
ncbi:BnaC03g59160D [Brassica napus]|uniref:BnaC03g59160D protein n=1 Tax=Brassica napus TaxID=3708 RepID=A0A078HC04_BRANA|nr:BnaC03g59160D [Brassica napus]